MIFILSYFILGILFAKIGMPFLDSLATMIVTYLQIPEAKASYTISQYNVKIADLADSPTKSFTVGFKAPQKEETNDEEEIL